MNSIANMGHVDDFITADVKDLLDDMVTLRRSIQHNYRGPVLKFAEMAVGLVHEKYDIPEAELRELLIPLTGGDPPHVEEPPEKPKKAPKAPKVAKAPVGPEVLCEDCTACMKIKNKVKGPRGKHTCGWGPAPKVPKAPKEDHGTCVCFPKGERCTKPATKLEVTGEYAGQWACNACWHCPRCPIMLETGKPCKERCVKDWKFQTCKFHGTKWFREDLPAGANPQGVEETRSESSQKGASSTQASEVSESGSVAAEPNMAQQGLSDEFIEEPKEEEAVDETSEKEKKMAELRAQLAAMEMSGEGPKKEDKNTFEFTRGFLEDEGDGSDNNLSKYGIGDNSDEESDDESEDESDGELPVFTSRRRENKPKVKIHGLTRR